MNKLGKLIVAHRGAPRLAHENTLASFQKALEIGADIIEFDIRKTRDGTLVVFHDAEILGQLLARLNFLELNQIAKTQNFLVPTLEETLKFLNGKAQLQIEIKEQGYELEIAAKVLRFLNPAQFTVISFNFSSLRKIKLRYPQVKTGLILGDSLKRLGQTLKFCLRRREFLTYLDMLSISWKLRRLGFARLIPQKYPITAWTADEPNLIIKLLKDPRVGAVASNLPDLALKLKNSLPEI